MGEGGGVKGGVPKSVSLRSLRVLLLFPENRILYDDDNSVLGLDFPGQLAYHATESDPLSSATDLSLYSNFAYQF